MPFAAIAGEAKAIVSLRGGASFASSRRAARPFRQNQAFAACAPHLRQLMGEISSLQALGEKFFAETTFKINGLLAAQALLAYQSRR